MAVVMIEGFDMYNGTGLNTGIRAKWGGASTANMVAGRFGGQAYEQQAGGGGASRSFTAASAFACGLALRMTTMTTDTAIRPAVYFLSGGTGGTYMVGWKPNPDGSIAVYRLTSATAGTTLGTSAAGVILVNTWHYVEIEVVISDTVGVFTVTVDGVVVLNLTSQDTRNGAPTTVDTVIIGSVTNSAANGVAQFDDFYLTDSATKLGPRRVETLYPTSDVAQGFGRSTGAVNFSLVDEATVNSDTDYVQASSVGTVDAYGFQDLTGTPTTIDAVQFNAFARQTDAAARQYALQVISGATTSDGSNFVLSSSYNKQERLMLLDPNGSITWTAANVNALQGGPKVTV